MKATRSSEIITFSFFGKYIFSYFFPEILKIKGLEVTTEILISTTTVQKTIFISYYVDNDLKS